MKRAATSVRRSPGGSQVKQGGILDGLEGKYKITSASMGGAFGDVYKAARIGKDRGSEEVVVKVPRLPKGITPARALDLLPRLLASYAREKMALDLLVDSGAVAHAVDIGLCSLEIAPKRSVPVAFIVLEFVSGKRLREWVRDNKPMSAKTFFRLARQITTKLLDIHQGLIVHGDIWPNNIMIREDNKGPVFIDLGQAVFRDLGIDWNASTIGKPHPYLAPERGGTVEADIFALGGLLHFLATAEDPPPTSSDIDLVKHSVLESLRTHNRQLFDENCGVADIIARCLRHGKEGRTPHAQAVLHEIDLFDPPKKRKTTTMDLTKSLAKLREQKSHLFVSMIESQIESMVRTLEDMAKGIFDLYGSHEDVVTALTEYLAALGPGDQYITVSTPQFWKRANVGSDGRFLAMNQVAVLRGANIRRVFLLTEDDCRDAEYKRIIDAQLRVANDLRAMSKFSESWRIEASHDGNYYVSYLKRTDEQRKSEVRGGWHVGLLYRRESALLLAAIYREDGTIGYVQFRSAPNLIEGCRIHLDELLMNATPLTRDALEADSLYPGFSSDI